MDSNGRKKLWMDGGVSRCDKAQQRCYGICSEGQRSDDAELKDTRHEEGDGSGSQASHDPVDGPGGLKESHIADATARIEAAHDGLTVVLDRLVSSTSE